MKIEGTELELDHYRDGMYVILGPDDGDGATVAPEEFTPLILALAELAEGVEVMRIPEHGEIRWYADASGENVEGGPLNPGDTVIVLRGGVKP